MFETKYYSSFLSLSQCKSPTDESNCDEHIIEKVDDIIDKEKEKYDLKKGGKANRNMYPVLSWFGIPVDNPKTASALISELLSICQLKEKEKEKNW